MQTIGERLEDARKKRGISIREAAEATKIRGEYLQKFEGNQFDIGLTEIYTRGFLRGYANYLRLPADRLLADYTAQSGSETRHRAPSRDVYGRMDLSISSSDGRPEEPTDGDANGGAARPGPRFHRAGENLPKGPPIDPALVLRGGKWIVGILVVALVVWIVKLLVGSGPPAPVAAPTRSAAPITEASQVSPAPVVSIVALESVRIKVVRKSDGMELFQGALQSGDRRDYPNEPLYLTASELASIELEYKGRRYPTGHSGHDRIQFDFSSR